MGSLGFLIVALVLAVGVFNFFSSQVINQLRSDLVAERRQRIAFELFQMARQYYAERKKWPTSVNEMVSMTEYEGPNKVDPRGWALKISADVQTDDWTICISRTDSDLQRTFAVV